MEPNFTTKFQKNCAEFFNKESATHNVSKMLSFIKIHPRSPEISSILCQKTCEIGWNSFLLLFFFYSTSFSANLTRFLTLNWRYLRSPWMDFDEWWHFGNVMSCTFHNKKNSLQNFTNFIAKFGSKVEISLKLEELKWIFLEYLRSFKLFVGTYITFLKGNDVSYP